VSMSLYMSIALHDINDSALTYAVISFLRSLARYESPGLSLASGFEHPASTLPTRFPAALGIGHGLPAD